MSDNTVDLTIDSDPEAKLAAEVMASWKYPETDSPRSRKHTDAKSPRNQYVPRKEIWKIARRAARKAVSGLKPTVDYQSLLEQEITRLEADNRELRDQLTEVRTQTFNWSLDGWTQHLSYVARPGEWYWYHQDTEDRVWDDYTPVVGEPNWWVMDDWQCGLTQYFQTHCPGMVSQIPRLLQRWSGNEWGLWEKVCQPLGTSGWSGSEDEGEAGYDDDDDGSSGIYWCREELEASHYEWYRSLGYTEAQSQLLAKRRRRNDW